MITPLRWIGDLWIGVGLVWLVMAFSIKRAARVESIGSRLAQSALIIPAAFLMLPNRVAFGILGSRFLPDVPLAGWIGLGLTAAGIAIAIAARIYLGRNWSARVTMKQGHELIRRGPYAIVRNPMYSGILVAMAGTAIAIGQVHCLLGVSLAIAAFRVKARVEERFLAEQFGPAYAAYQREVKGALIPNIL